MKKINLLLAFALSLLIFGCQKEKEIKPLAQPAESSNLTVINERNSTPVNWNELPDKLKNASLLTSADQGSELGRITASYKYPLGPWGGSGGTPYSIYPLGAYDKIYAYGIRSDGTYVTAFTVWYITPGGTLYYYNVGGTAGSVYIKYLAGNEYIYAIGGRSGLYVDRLSIYSTNGLTNYLLTVGGNGGSPFYAQVNLYEQILGFFGGAGVVVDRIGAYVYTF
jgi:hypothetical protein